MSLNNFIPTVWSGLLLASLKKSLVFGQEGVANRDYQGEVTGFGGSVKINSIGDISIGSYAKNGTISLQQLDDATQTLTINQSNYFNFMVDDIDTVQQNPKVMAQAMQDAAYGLRDKADQFIAGLFNAATTGIGGAGGVQIDKTNAYDYLVELAIALDEKNVPREGRWVVVPPWVHGKLLQDSRFIAAGVLGDQVIQNGFVGRAAGFDILSSNNVVKEDVGGDDVYRIMSGHRIAISYVEQIQSVEAFRPEGRFADAVKGLHLFGAKVVRPDALVVLNAKQ
jgi:hypothetical protein